MKTALTALAVIAMATAASANDFTVISKDAVGAGAIEIVTRADGEFTLTHVTCIPMQAGVVDTADSVGDLDDDDDYELAAVTRGTVEHDIAVAACS